VDELIAIARSLFARGYSFGTAGNLSARDGGEVWITPTNSSFETVEALARIALDGRVLEGQPSKEAPFHLAIYRARPDAGGVVHLHARYTTALACLEDLPSRDALPPLTPYFAMKVPRLAVVPYYPPGDERLGDEVGALAVETPALLLRSHGLITFGPSIRDAAALAEEVEEQAHLFFLLGNRARRLSSTEVAELRRRFQ
jgi:ribulose-5-phosphate 4-epimerase/fuculose-1-phosphate aldolase